MAIPSSRNCHRISRRLAPSALRMPISRVRSFTDTNMMFMMPTPPMASVSTPMNESTTLSPVVMPPICLHVLDRVVDVERPLVGRVEAQALAELVPHLTDRLLLLHRVDALEHHRVDVRARPASCAIVV